MNAQYLRPQGAILRALKPGGRGATGRDIGSVQLRSWGGGHHAWRRSQSSSQPLSIVPAPALQRQRQTMCAAHSGPKLAAANPNQKPRTLAGLNRERGYCMKVENPPENPRPPRARCRRPRNRGPSAGRPTATSPISSASARARCTRTCSGSTRSWARSEECRGVRAMAIAVSEA